MEERQEVKTYRIRYKCPNCKTGYLEQSGTIPTTNLPMFRHKCNVGCGYTQTLNHAYPRLVHEPIKDLKK